ncbi:hypothetical protein E3N88_21253 [Mikania micrantha]|uniref:4-coumarate--CoA ligase n=1 Tax=Mikania micrantha TaxID=192012 RepID=A0A5N6NKX6_9ASTR|nr:hypothetical protein E3N88_21253 [Mikania micrantha]
MEPEKEIIFRSKLPDIYIPKHLPLHSYCFENIANFSHRPCLIDGATGQVYTYSDVELTSRKVASALHQHGISKGDVIMILLPNSPEFVYSFLGASYLGAVSTMANPFFTAAEIIKQAKASGAKIIVTQSSHVPKVHDYLKDNSIEIICIDSAPEGCSHFSELISGDETKLPQVEISSDDVVALPYSSGTTGLPKGVMLTHKGLVTSVAQQVDGENPNLWIHSEDGYGMTEAGPVLAMCLAFAKEPFEIKSGACGTVVRNAEMKIVDPESGVSLPRNQRGEICIRGDQIMKGYLNDPEATKRTIDSNGWLHTGDIGLIDDDDELFIVDRLKELIKYKGFQVAPAELEALLLTHPDISDAAVVPMVNEAAGEVPVAFVVKINGSSVTEDDIKQFVSKQVVFYKRINRVFFINTIPKSPSGKILRKELRAKLAAGVSN